MHANTHEDSQRYAGVSKNCPKQTHATDSIKCTQTDKYIESQQNSIGRERHAKTGKDTQLQTKTHTD